MRATNPPRCELPSDLTSPATTAFPRRNFHAHATNSISPAFEWAQSGDWVYINAKMSHKLDAPATLNVVSEGVQMGERSLKFAASKDHKRFALDLALHADIDPDVSVEQEIKRGREETIERGRVTMPYTSVWPRPALNGSLLSATFDFTPR